MKILYPGTFNPWTIGHQYVLNFLIDLFGKDNVIVGVASNPDKSTNIEKILWHLVPVHKNTVRIDGLVSTYCKDNDIQYIARGLRTVTDCGQELDLAEWNLTLQGIKTFFVPCSAKLQKISSSAVRLLHSSKVDVQEYFGNPYSYNRWTSFLEYPRSKRFIYFGQTCVGKSFYTHKKPDCVDFDQEIWKALPDETIAKYFKELFRVAISLQSAREYDFVQSKMNVYINWNSLFSTPNVRMEVSALGAWWHLIPPEVIANFTLVKVTCSDAVREQHILSRNMNRDFVTSLDYFYKDPAYWDLTVDTSPI